MLQVKKIIRGIQAGIDDLIPALRAVARDRWQGEDCLFFSVTVEHDKKVVALVAIRSAAPEEKGQGVTFGRPVLLAGRQ